MAGGSAGRSLEQTPTWAVAVVCFVLVSISIIIEFIIHLIAKWLTKKRKRALYEALEKMKSELVLLGFISLLLTVGKSPISSICISKKAGATWHPCNKKEEAKLNKSEDTDYENRRKLLSISGSADGIHQLHIFIFVLAVFHILYCILTLALGRAKMKSWKRWEKETRTAEYQFSHDPERFRFARETSFGRRHLSFWTKTPVLIWIAHLAPQSHTKFDFQKYINRSLEEDFKVVVGIRLVFLSMASIYPIDLLVGTKLQVIITKMGLRIQERGEVVKGVPVVQPGDDLFWFNRPRLVLYLINFVLFQMGSSMKPTIFNERVATALRNWHHTAKKNIKQNNGSVSVTPMSSRPTTPSHHASPVHLLRHYRGEMDSLHTSPRRSNVGVERWETESPSPSHPAVEGSSSHRRQKQLELASAVGYVENDRGMETCLNHDQVVATELQRPPTTHHEIDVVRKEFSFDRRTANMEMIILLVEFLKFAASNKQGLSHKRARSQCRHLGNKGVADFEGNKRKVTHLLVIVQDNEVMVGHNPLSISGKTIDVQPFLHHIK
ncbi:hypothetical protein SADUNF_Sadunf09G0009900 [Salix dunnii]|uniref:MLO-like protein n=1 Tax=Salix dunnii TaxID=1413687 RepID=A0A835JW11_9ROSI|nr:hypothetical protein SADUNF_Sadunf09G0009900 [Salix dunnii]